VTEDTARKTANILMAAAVVGVGVYIVRTPPLRRFAWRLMKEWTRGPAAAWTAATVRDAWSASARSA
jgi:hypothetical protein